MAAKLVEVAETRTMLYTMARRKADMTARDLSRTSGIPYIKVLKACKRGDIPAEKLQGEWQISWADARSAIKMESGLFEKGDGR